MAVASNRCCAVGVPNDVRRPTLPAFQALVVFTILEVSCRAARLGVGFTAGVPVGPDAELSDARGFASR